MSFHFGHQIEIMKHQWHLQRTVKPPPGLFFYLCRLQHQLAPEASSSLPSVQNPKTSFSKHSFARGSRILHNKACIHLADKRCQYNMQSSHARNRVSLRVVQVKTRSLCQNLVNFQDKGMVQDHICCLKLNKLNFLVDANKGPQSQMSTLPIVK